MLSEENKIYIFGLDASTEPLGNTQGAVYDDQDWLTNSTRTNGAVEGIASSQDYNTALRQSSMMASILAEAMFNRKGQTSVSEIGTTLFEGETNLNDHIANLATILNVENFIQPNEITTIKINNGAVTNTKIANNAVNGSKLGNILGTNTSTANNITATLSQSSGSTGGSLSIALNCSKVTNSERIQAISSTGAKYLLGTSSNVSNAINTPQFNPAVYENSGRIYCVGVDSTSYIQATYFNATSDVRLKNYVAPILDEDAIDNIVENTNIVTFNYKPETGYDFSEKHIGIVAQDVAKKDIDNFKLINTDDNGMLSVKESKLVYILWKYIQKLNKRISELECKWEER